VLTAFLILSAFVNAALALACRALRREAASAWSLCGQAQDSAATATLQAEAFAQQAAQAQAAGQAQGRAQALQQIAAGSQVVEGGAFAINRLDSGGVHIRVQREGEPKACIDVLLPREVARGLHVELARALIQGGKVEGVA